MNDILAKQRKWVIAVIFTAIIFSTAFVYARTKEHRPICNIEGIIESVKFKDFTFSTDPSIYLLGININSVSSGGGDETGFYSCKDFYTIGKVREVFIVESDIKTGDIFSVGQKISGEIDDVGYHAGSLDGMRLVYYVFKTVTPQDKQLGGKIIEPTTNPATNTDNEIKRLNDIGGESEAEPTALGRGEVLILLILGFILVIGGIIYFLKSHQRKT